MAENSIKQQRAKEGRGKFLTIILLLHSIIGVSFLFIVSSKILQGQIENYGIILNLVYGAFYVFLAFSIPTLWKWSKFGIYAVIYLFLVIFANTFMTLLPFTLYFAGMVGPSAFIVLIRQLLLYLFIAFVYFLPIKRKWHLFS